MRTFRTQHAVLLTVATTSHVTSPALVLYAWDFGDYLIKEENPLKRREMVCFQIFAH